LYVDANDSEEHAAPIYSPEMLIPAYGVNPEHQHQHQQRIFTAVRTSILIHHHHHQLDSPTWALAFLRSFCQLTSPAIASSDFVTRVFSRVGLSAPRPTPGYLEGPKLSVRVVSLS
jgi:hypothetical protein